MSNGKSSGSYAEHIEDFRSDRRDQFLNAASEVLATSGIRQGTMNAIAASAGVSKVVLYRYFGAKDQLVNAVLERVVDKVLEANAAYDGLWTNRVRHTLQVVIQYRHGLILLLKHAAHDPEYGAHYERLRNTIVEHVESDIERNFGQLSAKPLGEGGLSAAVTTFFLGAYLQWLEEGGLETEAEFFNWVTRSVQAMCHYWYRTDPPRVFKDQ